MSRPNLAAVAPIGNSAVLQVSHTFPWQSWFDSTKLEQAIAIQPSGTPIVLPQSSDYDGLSIICHRSSQTPIAVTMNASQGGSPTVYTLAPGQAIAPLGGNRFRSFRYGLPYGWLGGGMAQLQVTQQVGEPTFGDAKAEVLFHRARFPIKQANQLTTVVAAGNYQDAPLNWPLRFPWVQNKNSSGVSQPGQPLLAPTPTRIVMTLRPPTASPTAVLAAPASMRAIIEGSDDFNLDALGVAGQLDQSGRVLTSASYPIFDEFTWPTWAQIGTSGNLSIQNPELTIADKNANALLRLGCSGIPFTTTAVGVVFVDDNAGSSTGTGPLAGWFVDVVRYGVL
ncbi:MAG: hypothetical protein ACYC6M_03130 [Terriglobales bacterium]